jgi:WD40 repeat protein
MSVPNASDIAIISPAATADTAEYTFDAFISYCQSANRDVARRLRAALHRFAKPMFALRAMRVFLDQTSLAPRDYLTAELRSTLDKSAHLILLACPDAANSPWVRLELDYWLRHRRGPAPILVITAGTIVWDARANDFDWGKTDALPRILSGAFAGEPLYFDLRSKDNAPSTAAVARLDDVVARLSALLRQRPLDELQGEDVAAKRLFDRLWHGGVALLSVLLVVAGIGWYFADQASRRALERSLTISAKDLAERARDAYRLERAAAYAIEANARSQSAEAWASASLVADRLSSRTLNRGVEVRRALFDSSGKYLFVGWVDGALGIIEIDTGRWIIRESVDSKLADIAVSLDGHSFAAAWSDGEVRIFSGPDWKLSGRTKVKVDSMQLEGLSVVLSGDAAITIEFLASDLLAVAGGDRVTILNGKTAVQNRTMPLRPYWGMWSSGDGRRLAATDNSRTYILDIDRIDSPPKVLLTEKAANFAWSQDGASFAWIDAKNDLRISVRGSNLGPFSHSGWVKDILFGPDGKHVITQTLRQSGWSFTNPVGDNVTRVFELSSGREQAKFSHTNQPGPIANTRDGLIVSVQGSRLVLLDPSSFAEKASVPHVPASANLALSPDGRTLASSDYDGVVRVWDLDSGASRAVGYHEGPIRHTAFSPDGNAIVSIGGDRLGDARVVHVDPINVVGARRSIAGSLTAGAGFATDPAGGLLYVAPAWTQAGTRNIERLDLVDGSIRHIWSTTSEIESMTFSPNIGILFVQSSDNSIAAISVADQKAEWRATSARSPNGAPTLIGRGNFVQANDASKGAPFLIDTRTGKRIALPGPEPHATVLHVDPSGRFFAYLDADNVFRLYRADNHEPEHVFKTSSFFAAGFAADGQWFAVAEDPDILQIVSLERAAMPITVRIGGKVVDVNFMPDGRNALVEVSTEPIVDSENNSGDKPNSTEIVLLELTTGNVRWRYRLLDSQPGPTWKFISPSGSKIAVGGENRQGIVLNANLGAELLKVHFSDLVRTAAFDPSERYVAFGSSDGTVQFADLEQLSVRGVMRGGGDVWHVAFAGSGNFIAVQSDSSIELFAVDPFSLLCKKDGRNLSAAEWFEVGGLWFPPQSCRDWRSP